MATIYVLSIGTYSGKTAMSLGLGMHMQADGYSIGYMKPVSTAAILQAGQPYDPGMGFVKKALDLPQSLEVLAPVLLTPQRIEALLATGSAVEPFAERVKESYELVRQGRDVVILEGATSLREGNVVKLSAVDVARLVGDARALAVVRYEDAKSVDNFLTAKIRLGDLLMGVVVNMVPELKMDFAETTLREYLEGEGIPVYAVLPQVRILQATSIGELADGLGAEILTCPENRDQLVEHLMVGAMEVDHALRYFRRRPNKAVITGGDRSDIQSAALETSTRCLILTGNLYPSAMILARAEEVGVTVMLAPQDTLTATDIAESFFGQSRFLQDAKVETFNKMLDKRFDFKRLYAVLGLEKKA